MKKLLLTILIMAQACIAHAQHCCAPDTLVRELRFPLTEQDTNPVFYYFNDEWLGGATLDMVPVDSIRKMEVKDDEYGNRAVFLTVSPEMVEDIRAQLRNRWLNFDPICEYPGGNGKFKEWIADNLKVPEDFKGSEIVLVRVTILPDGTVTDPKLIKPSKNDAANQEALRLVGLLPKFRIQYCTPKKSPLYYNIPFRFTEPGTIFIRGDGMDN